MPPTSPHSCPRRKAQHQVPHFLRFLREVGTEASDLIRIICERLGDKEEKSLASDDRGIPGLENRETWGTRQLAERFKVPLHVMKRRLGIRD